MGEAQPVLGWSERNQRWLARSLRRFRHASRRSQPHRRPPLRTASMIRSAGAIARAARNDDFTPALDRCADIFALSPFERELLLLDGRRRAGQRVAARRHPGASHAGGRRAFGSTEFLAGAARPAGAALGRAVAAWPVAPLAPRRPRARRSPAQQPLHIDERILHYLTGVARPPTSVCAA